MSDSTSSVSSPRSPQGRLKVLVCGPEGSGKSTFIQAWQASASRSGATVRPSKDSLVLSKELPQGHIFFDISELRDDPKNLVSRALAKQQHVLFVLLCRLNRPMEELAPFITALSPTSPQVDLHYSVILVVVTEVEKSTVAQRRDAGRDTQEASILAWSTQMVSCVGLFEFSREQTNGEELGIKEYIAGVNEFAGSLLSDDALSSPRNSDASSDSEQQLVEVRGLRASSSGGVSRKRTGPGHAPPLLSASQPTRPYSNPSSSGPAKEWASVDVSALRKAEESSDTSKSSSSSPKSGWLAVSPRETPPASQSVWSSATRPTTPRAPKSFISHSPDSTSSGPSISLASPEASSAPPASMVISQTTTSSKTMPLPKTDAPPKATPKLTTSISVSVLSPVRSLTNTLSGNLGLKKKNSAPKISTPKELQLEPLQPKQFARLPKTVMATVSASSKDHHSLSKWFASPMKIRIQVNRNNTIVALYTAENESQEPEHIFSMSAYSKDPTEMVTPSLTGVSNNGYPLAVFTEPTIPHFFWIRENSGLNGNFILLTASDSTSMSGYLRTAFQGISFMPMKSGAFMAVFMHHWAESCTVGIPPEPKQAIDLACADKSDSRYMLESLHLFETEASTIPALVQSLHWFPYLCDLTIHGCNVTDEEAVPIINSLILNPYLKSLAMPANQLSTGSVLAIQSLLSRPSKRLMILDISHNPFPVKSANAILDSLANNTCVKRFSMLGVPLTHKSSILSLTQLLERNHSLFCLRLQVALQKTTSETMMAPIFNALMNNITINLLDLGLPSDSATRTNMDILVERNARGASSLTLAGWVSEPWAKLLEFVPTKTEHFQLMLRAAEEKNGVSWKGVASFTGTLEEGPTGTLNINSEGIFFTPSSVTPHPQTSNSTPAPHKIFYWSSTLKIGQLTTDPVLLVFYDPAKFPDPLVITLPTSSQVLEVVLCLNSLESCGIAKSSSSNSNSSNSAAPASVKPGQRNRSHAVRTNDELPTIESLLDFSKVVMGDLLAPAGGSGTEVRIACLNGFECCVKIMDCSQYGQDAVDSMEKEISLLIMLKQSKQIVQYLHHDKSGHQLRLYMELFPSSLRKTIKSRAESQTPFTAQQVYILARKILKGLRFLHTQTQPIVHRDIKSDNVLVEEDLSGNFLRVKLTDFGSAKILTRGRTSSIDQGTSGYQAPEMVRSDNSSAVGNGVSSAAHAGSNGGNDASSVQLSYTTAVDIFSFGITLYEILALQKVYPNCNSRQELEEALRNAEKYPPDFQLVPRQLLHFLLIVSPCLKRNYAERPTAAELIVELDKLATGLGLKKQPSLPPPSSFKSRPKATLNNTGSSIPSSPSTVNSIRK